MHARLLAWLIPDLSRQVSLTRLLWCFTPRRVSRWYRHLSAGEIIHLVETLLRNPRRMRGRRCLRLGLLAFYFLKSSGACPKLHFGVYPLETDRTRAHCWVTIDGHVMTEPATPPFAEMLVHG